MYKVMKTGPRLVDESKISEFIFREKSITKHSGCTAQENVKDEETKVSQCWG